MNELLSLNAETEQYGTKVQDKLWRLLTRQVKSYTLGDSGSLPEEVAAELFTSVLYTLKRFFSARGEDLRALALQDEDEVFDAARQSLEADLQAVKGLYRTVAAGIPRLGSRALEDTLQNIGVGLERYDYRLFAHEVPCEIDYQLCRPVPDDFQGIDWVREYLGRLGMEGAALSRFDGGECRRFLEGRFPGYRELLINLFEEVAARALGRVLTEEGLALPHLERCALSLLPGDLTREGFRQGADRLFSLLRLPGEFAAYWAECLDSLWPRYAAARDNGTLGNVL